MKLSMALLIESIISYLILSSFLSRDRKILVKAYVTYVRPILEYCSAVWSPYRIDLINKLEDVQQRFTKKLNGLANLLYAKCLEILGLDALQTRRIESDLVQCYSIVHRHSCMKPAHFLSYIIVLVLVLLEDIILNCLSLSVVLMCRSIVLHTGLSISGTACQVILLMLVAFLYLNTY